MCALLRERHPDSGDLALLALTGETSARLEWHLGHCAACRGTLEEFRRIVTAARAAGSAPVPPPQSVWEGILRRL